MLLGSHELRLPAKSKAPLSLVIGSFTWLQTYADVCRRMLTYADVCSRMQVACQEQDSSMSLVILSWGSKQHTPQRQTRGGGDIGGGGGGGGDGGGAYWVLGSTRGVAVRAPPAVGAPSATSPRKASWGTSLGGLAESLTSMLRTKPLCY